MAPGATAPQCAAIQNLLLPETLPAARGNAHGDDFNAAYLGYSIFFDARFSANEQVRCASCHAPEDHFNDNKATPDEGLGAVPRNAPILLNAAWNTWQFWDGRADTLWSQPLYTLEAVNEMNFTRLNLAHAVAAYYSAQYAAVYGPLPDLSTLPASGKPGDAAFDNLPKASQDAVNLIAANVGKSIEGYLRHVASGRSPFDDFLTGQSTAIAPAAQRGIVVFAKAGCLACHNGPNLTDNKFHNLGVPALPGASDDAGRAVGLVQAAHDPFNQQGIYYDGPRESGADENPADAASLVGAFRTPSLRNLGESWPYGHNGTFATLEDVINFHLQGGGHNNVGYAGSVDPLLVPQQLTSQELADLVAFLQSIVGTYTGSYTSPPLWWDWPDR